MTAPPHTPRPDWWSQTGALCRGVSEIPCLGRRGRGENGQYYFSLVAPNSETIASSEGYEARAGAENDIRAVKEYAPEAEIDDKT